MGVTGPRVAFVDHSYHKTTASSRFFVELLTRECEVTEVAWETWRGSAPVTAERVDCLGADAVVFWQSLPSAVELLRLRTPVVWVPMYDTAARYAGKLFWQVVREKGVRVISFCRAMSRLGAAHGVRLMSGTYYPDPDDFPQSRAPEGGLRVMLWDRGEVGFARLRRLLGNQPVAETIVRLAPDPGLKSSPPTRADIARYNIRVIAGPLTRDEHLGLLAGCQVFVAPRELEGIGLANLEAMAMGLAVVAPDRPTMNEYIRSGANGYLYDPWAPRSIDLTEALAVGRQARADALDGHRRWLAAAPTLLAAALAPSEGASVSAGAVAAARALSVGEGVKRHVPPMWRAMIASRLRAWRP